MRTLKIITKIIFLTLGLILTIPTIFLIFIDDTPDKWYGIIPLIVFGVPFVYFGFKIKIEPKSINSNDKPIRNSIKQEQNPVEKFTLTDFKVANVRGKQFQLLESLDIISSSINIDIVIGRYEFINEILPDLIKYKSLDLYKSYFLEVIEKYKTMYFDKVIQSDQIHFISNPDDSNYLLEYYLNNLMRAYKSTVNKHIEDIKGMKQKKAIIGRYDKIINISEIVKETIESLPIIEKRHDYLDEIFKIRRDASIEKDIL